MPRRPDESRPEESLTDEGRGRVCGMGMIAYETVLHAENSDVLWAGSVAVAVMS